MNKTIVTAAIFLSIMIGLGTTATNAKAQFIANTTSAGIKPSPTDPNYSVYQNLGLGFNMEYISNMTVFENHTSSTKTIILFTSPHIGKPHLVIADVLVIPVAGVTLDEVLSQALANMNQTVISKTQGILNSLPAYRVELVKSVLINNTQSIVPVYTTIYATFKGALAYVIYFATADNPSQTNFLSIEKTMIDSFKYN